MRQELGGSIGTAGNFVPRRADERLPKDVFVIGKGVDSILEKVKKDPEYLSAN